MKKTTISAILALTVLSCLTASAQWRAGIQAGYTHNWLYTESGYFYTRTYEPRGGFSIGVPVQYEFEDWFALQAEVSYIQKNYRMQRTGFYSPLHENMTNHYLSIPVLAHFSFGGDHLRGFLNAGFYAGGWLASRRQGAALTSFGDYTEYDYPVESVESLGTLYHYDEKYPFNSTRDNRFEAGAAVGAGLQYEINDLLTVLAECRYYYSLTDLQKDYMKMQVPRYLNTMLIQIGLLITLDD